MNRRDPLASDHDAVVSVADQKARGVELFEAGRFDDASGVFASVLRKHPDRLGIHMWLVRCQAELGDDERLHELLDDAITRHDELPEWADRELRTHGYLVHHGVKLCLDHRVISDWMRWRIMAGGYEDLEAGLVAQSIRPGDRVLEVGGGIGFMASFAEQQAPDVSVVMFEANPNLTPVIDHTRALNGATFEHRSAMLGSSRGEATFHVHEAFWASSATGTSDDSVAIQVPVEPVNELLTNDQFTMLIMDIEGGEIELVPAMDLTTVTRIVIETHPDVTGKRSVKSLLKHLNRNYGFTPVQEHHAVYLLERD